MNFNQLFRSCILNDSDLFSPYVSMQVDSEMEPLSLSPLSFAPSGCRDRSDACVHGQGGCRNNTEVTSHTFQA